MGKEGEEEKKEEDKRRKEGRKKVEKGREENCEWAKKSICLAKPNPGLILSMPKMQRVIFECRAKSDSLSVAGFGLENKTKKVGFPKKMGQMDQSDSTVARHLLCT